jgi:uncharacterized membrane protein
VVAKMKRRRKRKGPVLLGIVIVLIGVALLMKNFFDWFNFNYIWPIIIIAIGLYFMRGKDEN